MTCHAGWARHSGGKRRIAEETGGKPTFAAVLRGDLAGTAVRVKRAFRRSCAGKARLSVKSTGVGAGDAPPHHLGELEQQRPLIRKDLAQRHAQAEIVEPVDLGKLLAPAGTE